MRPKSNRDFAPTPWTINTVPKRSSVATASWRTL